MKRIRRVSVIGAGTMGRHLGEPLARPYKACPILAKQSVICLFLYGSPNIRG